MGPDREIITRSADNLSEELRESSRSTSDLGAGVQSLTNAVESLKNSLADSRSAPGTRNIGVAQLENTFTERGGLARVVSKEVESVTRSLGRRIASLPAEFHRAQVDAARSQRGELPPLPRAGGFDFQIFKDFAKGLELVDRVANVLAEDLMRLGQNLQERDTRFVAPGLVGEPSRPVESGEGLKSVNSVLSRVFGPRFELGSQLIELRDRPPDFESESLDALREMLTTLRLGREIAQGSDDPNLRPQPFSIPPVYSPGAEHLPQIEEQIGIVEKRIADLREESRFVADAEKMGEAIKGIAKETADAQIEQSRRRREAVVADSTLLINQQRSEANQTESFVKNLRAVVLGIDEQTTV